MKFFINKHSRGSSILLLPSNTYCFEFFFSKSKVPSFKTGQLQKVVYSFVRKNETNVIPKNALIFLTPISRCEIAGISELFCNPKAGFFFSTNFTLDRSISLAKVQNVT